MSSNLNSLHASGHRYDCSVDKRQDKVVTTAAKTNAIVDSFFPSHILDRVMMGEDGDRATSALSRVFENEILATKPIADRFPHATIMFADIVGFTAWSSVREPSQVFTLLEAVYNSFDKIAKRRRVFKVETIGDCYVAATGLPEPRDDHAVIMARFARDCLDKMREVAHQLEISLGPDTGDLTMRIGLHSGPVTGGVLRGDKSRFQLFGDTVNTAARIEGTGAKNKIHLSKETAELLQAAAKSRWVKARDELVIAKGTNRIQTYWLVGGVAALSSGCASDETTSPSERGDGVKTQTQSPDKPIQSNQNDRLIGWNVDVLTRSLKQIVAMRGQKKHEKGEIAELRIDTRPGESALDEVQEIITLPGKAIRSKKDPEDIDLGQEVILQLNDYVTTIACLYQDNPFHSFQHASHVTQSLTKLLSRVVATDAIDYDDMVYKKVEASALHKFTFGITSDPLTQFACTFSALIHDLDHPGVPNAQLVKEKVAIADLYKNKSVAEQNSVDIAWEMLMEERYKDLRACIYMSQAELVRFRQLVVNSVMATDIMDKELGAVRKRRWEKAFKIQKSPLSDSQTNANRKATIVIEHVIQAADVAHTMQHWHVYRKWNERLFNECYQAYLNGRADKDPSIGWYEGELGFFDFYLIPLAKKLEECGVFGVSSDECLNYATANRREWEMKGKGLVQEYLEPYKEGAKSGDDV
jgi:class 3 adenylate cyclase